MTPLLCPLAYGQSQKDAEASAIKIVNCEERQGEPHAIIRAMDSVTVVTDDGRTIKLASVMAPLAPLTAQMPAAGWEPEQAAHAALSELTAMGTPEISLEQKWRDRFGRSSAQIYIERASERIWLQRALVEQGHAIVSSRDGGASCIGSLLTAEDTARKAKRGLWANATYRVHQANDPSALRRLRSSFVLVEGTVVSVAVRSGRLFLNFGDDWKTDFTTVVPAHLLKDKPDRAKALSALAGHSIRVRGWIERRYGPSIEIFDLSDIEDLTAATASTAIPNSLAQ